MKKFVWLMTFVLLISACNRPRPVAEEDVVGTYAAATLTALPFPDQEQPQPTAGVETQILPTVQEGTDQPPAPTATLTYTPSPTATETPTPTATETATFTPVPDDPAYNLGTPDFLDTFENANNWYTYNEAQSSFEIEEGVFLLTAKKANSYETWALSWAELKNFYLEITGSFGEECSGKDRYGMIFRAPDTGSGYLVSLTCDGTFRLSSYDGEEYTVLKKFTSSEYAQTGPGAENRLGIKAKDSKLKVYLNGHQVLNINDGEFSKGRFGVLVAASNTAGFNAELTRVRYWELP